MTCHASRPVQRSAGHDRRNGATAPSSSSAACRHSDRDEQPHSPFVAPGRRAWTWAWRLERAETPFGDHAGQRIRPQVVPGPHPAPPGDQQADFPAFTASAAIGSGTCARPNPVTAAPSIVGMSLAIKGPETMTSMASLPLTKDQGAIDPFERRMRRQACRRRSSISSGRCRRRR